jgi:hypothetical protein
MDSESLPGVFVRRMSSEAYEEEGVVGRDLSSLTRNSLIQTERKAERALLRETRRLLEVWGTFSFWKTFSTLTLRNRRAVLSVPEIRNSPSESFVPYIPVRRSSLGGAYSVFSQIRLRWVRSISRPARRYAYGEYCRRNQALRSRRLLPYPS